MRAWQLAQAGSARCRTMASRSESCFAGLVALGLERRNVGRRRRRRRCQQILQNILAAQHRRGPRRIRGQQSGCCPAPAIRRADCLPERSPAGTRCREYWEFRSAWPAARSRRYSWRSAAPSRCDFRAGCCPGTDRFPARRTAASPSSKSRNRNRSGALTSTSRRYSHCAAKFVTIDSERGSASMRCTCCSSTSGCLQLAGRPRRSAARRPECCSTRRTTGARPVPDR